MIICHETFEIADPHRFAPRFDSARAFPFALRFLRADSAANRRKRTGTGNHFVRFFKFARHNKRNKFGDRNPYGTTRYARARFAIQTTFCFVDRDGFVVTERNFFKITASFLRRLRWHRVFFRLHIKICHFIFPPLQSVFYKGCNALPAHFPPRAPLFQTPHRYAYD